jgi:Protein of unknown function (DUF4232)
MNLTSHRGRSIIAAAVIACSAALVPAVALASSAAPSAPARIAQCRTGAILDWLANAPSGTAGSIVYPVEFSNLGRTCWLRGYPRVAGVTSRLRQIGPAAARSGTRLFTVVLRHDETAHAWLSIVVAGIIAGCHARTGAGLAVTRPGGRGRQFVMNFTFPACTNRTYMHIFPVMPGIGVP